ncbi:MAG: nicotinate (nicotinamide) nucleotide adenylyltransferase [Verrucomicrobiales bacterium]
MKSNARLGLFGGTFDPVHDGHLAIADEARKSAGLDRIIFLPARLSPHKSDQWTLATDRERLEMLRLATRGLDWAELSDWELHQAPPSYSWKTALHFRESFPGARLFWILGADQWEVIEKWAKPEILRESLEFLVFPRPPLLAPVPRPGWSARFLQTIHPASATAIRSSLAGGISAPQHLPPAIHPLARRIYGRPVSGDNPPQSGNEL